MKIIGQHFAAFVCNFLFIVLEHRVVSVPILALVMLLSFSAGLAFLATASCQV